MNEKDLLWHVYLNKYDNICSIIADSGERVHRGEFEYCYADRLESICQKHNQAVVNVLLNRKEG